MSAYTSYYAGQDVSVFVVASNKNLSTGQDGKIVVSGAPPVMLDKATFIGWQEMRIGSNPVFGIGDSKFRFKNRGNDIVSGQLSLNFTDERYLRVAITNALNPGAQNQKTAASMQNSTASEFRKQRDVSRQYGSLFQTEKGNGLDCLMKLRGFDIMVVFNNGNNIHQDKNKIIFLRECEIDGESLQAAQSEATQINRVYNFTAKRVD